MAITSPIGHYPLATTGSSLFATIPSADKYFNRFSEPVRLPRGIKVYEQQAAFSYIPVSPFGEAVTESRWHQAWSEPVRIKPGLKAGLQWSETWPVLSPLEINTESRWHQAWSEPVRVKPRLMTGLQMAETAQTIVPLLPIPQKTLSNGEVRVRTLGRDVSNPKRE